MSFVAALSVFQLGHEQANINGPEEIATGKSRLFLPGVVFWVQGFILSYITRFKARSGTHGNSVSKENKLPKL